MGIRDAVGDRDGWKWPIGDVETWPCVQSELAEIPVLVALCPQRRVCIQAGGNGGLWVKPLASFFERVYTFEPDFINFHCLVANADHPNVVFTQAALGEFRGWSQVDRWLGPRNPGANRMDLGYGMVPVVRIDDYGFENVDLIQLDIEGMERPALAGAIETIKRCRPVISVELRGHAGRYGYSDDDMRSDLTGYGYRLNQRMNHDEFWVPDGRSAQ